MILTATCGIEPSRIVEYKPLLDEAIELSQHKPEACLVLQRPQADANPKTTGATSTSSPSRRGCSTPDSV